MAVSAPEARLLGVDDARTRGEPDTQIPRTKPQVDVRQLALSPEEAFVYSRIDGRTTIREIGLTTGLTAERVLAALGKLAEAGAIDGAPPGARGETTATPANALSNAEPEPYVVGRASPLQSPSLAARLERLCSTVDKMTHYELLGVERTVDKKAIKSAYFRLVSEFHPDKYYGQALGDTKPQLERVFQALTVAHETLTRSKRRAEYDAALGPDAAARASGGVSAPAPNNPSSVPASRRSADKAGVKVTQPESSTVTTALAPAPPSAPEPRPVVSPSMDGASSDSRRARARASVARRLAGPGGLSSVPGSRTSIVPPNLGGAGSDADGAPQPTVRQPLRFPARPPGVKAPRSISSQIQRYTKEAEQHLDDDNPIAAANAMRLAVSLSPDDESLRARLVVVECKADERLADAHIASAKRAEQSGDWLTAARAYSRAARGRASGELYAQAAQCYLKDEEGLKSAAEQARKAVELRPDDANAHLLLGRIYKDAGMRQSAIATLETASSLKPGDNAIQSLLTDLKRGST
jgi:curved DNA-binding protein CbpA